MEEPWDVLVRETIETLHHNRGIREGVGIKIFPVFCLTQKACLTVVLLHEKSQPKLDPMGFFASIKAVTLVLTPVVTTTDKNIRILPLLLFRVTVLLHTLLLLSLTTLFFFSPWFF